MMLPWEYGGMNLPETIYQMMVEIVSRAEAGLMTIFGLQEIALSINEFGDDAMKARILPRFARGEVTGAMVLTEPDAGSDLGSVQTRATFDEAAGVWRINGVKRFITNGCADIMVVLARSEPDSNDARGLSLFLVEKDESVVIRRIENKMGLHASPTCEIQYNNTPAQLIGKRRFGLIRYAMALMNGARLAVAAQAVGIAEAAYREAYRYAHERVQFNQADSQLSCGDANAAFDAERNRGDARVDVRSRALGGFGKSATTRTSPTSAKPDPADRQALKRAARLAEALTPLTKYYATEMGNRVCYQAMQVHGGVGYMREFNVERHYPRYSRDEHLRRHQPTPSRRGHWQIAGTFAGRFAERMGGAGLWSRVGSAQEPGVEATALFNRSADHLKECPTEVIDYYASDVVDMATQVINSWLLLQHARADAKKKSIAQVYIGDHLPRMRGIVAAVQAADASPLKNRDAILASPF